MPYLYGVLSLCRTAVSEAAVSDVQVLGDGGRPRPLCNPLCGRGTVDRGAHHKGACVPTSVVENRARPPMKVNS
ncbi:MAG: hypothetical protein LBK25_01495 [Treponema sp.]|nr:hypothetical protein [Treponema sp.]